MIDEVVLAPSTSDAFVLGSERKPLDDAAGADVFYVVDAHAGDSLWVRLPVKSASSTVLYVLDSCDSSATCIAGKDATPDVEGDEDRILTHVFTSSGTYYLVVDTLSGSCGGPSHSTSPSPMGALSCTRSVFT